MPKTYRPDPPDHDEPTLWGHMAEALAATEGEREAVREADPEADGWDDLIALIEG